MARMLGDTHQVGCGGKGCHCCYPAPRHWAAMNRSAKRREKQAWRRDVARRDDE